MSHNISKPLHLYKSHLSIKKKVSRCKLLYTVYNFTTINSFHESYGKSNHLLYICIHKQTQTILDKNKRIMKNLLKLSIIIALGIMCFITGCKKYDDGPAISLRSTKARIIGCWEIYSYTDDGVEYFNEYSDSEIEFTKDGELIEINEDDTYKYTWELSSDKKTIETTSENGSTFNHTIKRLTKNEMWLERDSEILKLVSK